MSFKPNPVGAFKESLLQELLHRYRERSDENPYFKWVLIGGCVYICIRLGNAKFCSLWPVSKLFKCWNDKLRVPESVIIWFGGVESELPFGKLGYARCLEADTDVLEKFGIPMNTDKCLRDAIQWVPGEFYERFDLNQYDPKVTPLTWIYGQITDPSLIMPICWYNDLAWENQEFELFCKYMKVYGYLPDECYKEMYARCKVRVLSKNERLIRIGDPDDKAYIILSGAIDLFSNRITPNSKFARMRTAVAGGHISSTFSIIHALSGLGRNIQSIYAVSKVSTSKVLIFPIYVLKDYLVRHSEYLVPSLVRVLERCYRFQYQIMHNAMRLAKEASVTNPVQLFDPPDVVIPEDNNTLSDEIRDEAIKSFMNFLHIDDFEFVKSICRVVVVEPDEETNDINIIKQSMLNQQDTAYKYIYIGKMQNFYLNSNLGSMSQKSRRKPVAEVIVPQPLTTFYCGEGLGSLTGILGYYNVLFWRCLERSILVTLTRPGLERLLQRNPWSMFPIAAMGVSKMSPFLRAMDFAIDWSTAQEGQYIYHKDQLCEDSYLLLSGRARAYQLDSDAQHRAIFEYKENDWIGVVESLLQSKRRSRTCVVIRETEFAIIPNDLLRNIVVYHPDAAQVLLDFMVRRKLQSLKFGMHTTDSTSGEDKYKESRRVHSLALVPVSEHLPYSVLALEIKRHYLSEGSCSILTYEKTLRMIRREEITPKDQYLLEMYILQELEMNGLVIFICLPRVHYWNKVCSSHSEVVFTVGCSMLPNISTVPPDYEEEVVGKRLSTRRKELIILHTMDVKLPRNTKEWLYCRDWIHFHHHIRLPHTAFLFPGAIPEEVLMANAEYQAWWRREIQLSSDLSRFIRWIQGKTYGVIFSSGGARIGAQLGMLQALCEYDKIPIDMVVGTEAGFLLAACYAIYQDYSHVQNIIEKIFHDFDKDIAKLHWDELTFPFVNLGRTGKRLLMYLYQLFGSVQLEDTWIPICCVTTNLTTQDVRVDRSGPMWAFLRASLSNVNRSPPISDPNDHDYIIDGSHANSLPQDVIKEYGAEYIIAFNTVVGKFGGTGDKKSDPNISVFRYLKNMLVSVIERCGLASPALESVLEQLSLTQTKMYATGTEDVSNLTYVVYVRPPVEHIPSQLWINLPTLHRTGYFYMKAILDKNPYNPDCPFYEFWTGIKNTAAAMAWDGGKDLHYIHK